MDASAVAAATLAGHAGLTKQPDSAQSKGNKVDPFGAVLAGLIHHMDEVAHRPPPPPVWGSELEHPVLRQIGALSSCMGPCCCLLCGLS
eukprot:symbB.v1.2.018009.t1/scaffold1375.1/size122712/1